MQDTILAITSKIFRHSLFAPKDMLFDVEKVKKSNVFNGDDLGKMHFVNKDSDPKTCTVLRWDECGIDTCSDVSNEAWLTMLGDCLIPAPKVEPEPMTERITHQGLQALAERFSPLFATFSATIEQNRVLVTFGIESFQTQYNNESVAIDGIRAVVEFPSDSSDVILDVGFIEEEAGFEPSAYKHVANDTPLYDQLKTLTLSLANLPYIGISTLFNGPDAEIQRFLGAVQNVCSIIDKKIEPTK